MACSTGSLLSSSRPDKSPSVSSKGHGYSGEGSYFRRTNKQLSTSPSTQSLLATDKPTLLPVSSGDMSDTEPYPRIRLNSVYLTPPEEQNFDIPPYKPTRKDSTSLTMAKNGKTMPHHRFPSHRKRRIDFPSRSDRRTSGRRISKYMHWKQPTLRWTANDQARSMTLHNLLKPAMDSDESLRSKEHYMGASKEHQLRLIRLMSNPAIPVTTRRWSSVEVGADPIPLRSIKHAATENTRVNSTYRKVKDHQQKCLDAVQKILTSKRISVPRLNTPATITLRRASPPSPSQSPSSSVNSLRVSQPTTPRTGKHFETETPIAAYLITAHEIGKIISLIQDNMTSTKTYKSKKKSDTTQNAGSQAPRKMSVTTRGLVLDRSNTVETATTVTNIPGAFPDVHSGWGDQKTITKGYPNTRQVSVVVSRDSVHEIIWENDGYPRRLSSASPPSYSSSGRNSQEQVFNHDITVWNNQKGKLSTDIPPTIKPHSSSGLSETGESQSNSQSPLSEHQRKFKNYNPFNTIDIPKVESFPALPRRKGTNDWISPLPSMHSRESTPETNALYSQGIDATQRAASIPWDDAEQLTIAHEGNHSNTSLQPEENSPCHRKSVVLPHPEAASRLSTSISSGSAMGRSSHIRRRSTSRSPKVKIATPEPPRKKTWKKTRKDSGYPGITLKLGVSDDEQEISSSQTAKEKSERTNRRNKRRVEKRRRDSTHPEIITPRESDEEEMQPDGAYLAPRRSIWSIQVRSPSPERDTEHRKGGRALGIYESMTGAECSEGAEDARHECVEGLSTPSVDWIG